MLDKNKVVLGLSGGVDSTTAALLMKEKGLEVIGLYFDMSEHNEAGIKHAKATADQLGIKFISLNVNREFEHKVIQPFCREYIKGRTPNPCIICNPLVKFKTLLEEANNQGAYYIATGHYARTSFTKELGFTIRKAASEKKDQSYMLYRLGEEVISRLMFPMADMENKEQVREIAREKQLLSAELKDSQEICFIDGDYVDYIKKRGYEIKKGNFIDQNGSILGKHQGIVNYTVGQRKGLGITFGKPVFVTKLDSRKNTVTLGDNHNLLSCHVVSNDNFFPMSNGDKMPESLENAEVYAKIRYAAKPAAAVIHSLPDGRIETVFETEQRAATPGQSIVFYKDDCVIGGGFIEEFR